MIALAREVARSHTSGRRLADGAGAVPPSSSSGQPRGTPQRTTRWCEGIARRRCGWCRTRAITGLFDVPADYKLDVTVTPPPLRGSIDGAAYYPAPPFKNSGVGRFYVTPTHNDPAALRQEHNRAALADLSAHEGFPGHDWHYKVMTQYRDQHLAGALADPGRGRGLVLDVGGLDGGGRLGACTRRR